MLNRLCHVIFVVAGSSNVHVLVIYTLYVNCEPVHMYTNHNKFNIVISKNLATFNDSFILSLVVATALLVSADIVHVYSARSFCTISSAALDYKKI